MSVDGGGAWVVDGRGIAHFLSGDGGARAALEQAGIRVLAERDVVVQVDTRFTDRLQHEAHDACHLSNSVRTEIKVEPA